MKVDLKNITNKNYTQEIGYDELVFSFKSILYKFYNQYLNKEDPYQNRNQELN
jgi:hypothetical protein